MSLCKVSLGGFRELDRKLAKLERGPDQQAVRTLLRKGGNVLAREERTLVPVRSGRLRTSITVTTRPGFGVPDLGRGAISIFIGPRLGAGSRAHLIEFGTVHSAAHPFIRPALDATQEQISTMIVARLGDIVMKSVA